MVRKIALWCRAIAVKLISKGSSQSAIAISGVVEFEHPVNGMNSFEIKLTESRCKVTHRFVVFRGVESKPRPNNFLDLRFCRAGFREALEQRKQGNHTNSPVFIKVFIKVDGCNREGSFCIAA